MFSFIINFISHSLIDQVWQREPGQSTTICSVIWSLICLQWRRLDLQLIKCKVQVEDQQTSKQLWTHFGKNMMLCNCDATLLKKTYEFSGKGSKSGRAKFLKWVQFIASNACFWSYACDYDPAMASHHLQIYNKGFYICSNTRILQSSSPIGVCREVP